MKGKGQRSERARARLEFRHQNKSKVGGSSRTLLNPEGSTDPYCDPSSASLFQQRRNVGRKYHFGDADFYGNVLARIYIAPVE
jgi:hypothetical protein